MASTPTLSSENIPDFFSTVTPGQLPMRWRAPVSALNNVVLPQLGLPASAAVRFTTWLLFSTLQHAFDSQHDGIYISPDVPGANSAVNVPGRKKRDRATKPLRSLPYPLLFFAGLAQIRALEFRWDHPTVPCARR